MTMLLLVAGLVPGCIRLWPNPADPRLPRSIAWCEGAPRVLPVPESEGRCRGDGFAGDYGKDVRHCLRYLDHDYWLANSAELQVRVSTGDQGQIEAICAWAASFDHPDLLDCVVNAVRESAHRPPAGLQGELFTFWFFMN